jgi:hypothetical protein
VKRAKAMETKHAHRKLGGAKNKKKNIIVKCLTKMWHHHLDEDRYLQCDTSASGALQPAMYLLKQSL